MKNSVRTLLLCALSTLVLAACEKENEGTGSYIPKEGLTVVLSTDSPVTKSGAILSEATQVETYEIEGTDLKLVETVENLNPEPKTKGTPVYTTNIATVYPSLGVTAYNTTDKKQWGDADVEFKYNSEGKVYLHNYSEGADASYLRWPEDNAELRFFARAPYYATAQSDPCSSLVYSLTNSSAKASFAYSTPATATDQKDLIFGSEVIKEATKTSSSNVIEFYHVLTGVKFKLSDECISSDATKNITVSKVVFNKVKKGGNCEVETFNDGKNSEEVVKWTPGEATGSFSQNFTGIVTATGNEGFADSFKNGDTHKNNLNDAAFSQTFWFIPQGLDDVTLTITFKIGTGNEQTTTVSFGQGKSWKAGDLHTYTLTPKGPGIDIEDEVDGQIKTDVKITNKGNMPEYIRVAVVANWVDASGNVIASMTPDLGKLGDNWVKNGAYYYYTKEVNPGLQPGQATSATDTVDYLFEKYEVPTEAGKALGADHLEMSLAVQAIDTQAKKDYKEAWKAANVTFTE